MTRLPPTAVRPEVAVSVVMPVFNALPHLIEQLDSLCKQSFSGAWEVVVSDNGSTDGSLELVATYADQLPLRLVDASAKTGAAFARNTGAKFAAGRTLVFCDSDDVLDEHWIAAMHTALNKVDVVGGALDVRLLNPESVRAWRAVTTEGLDRPLGWLPAALSCNIGARADVFHAVGGFDETFLKAAEDTDFCWRVQLAGYTFGYAADAVVHYRLRGDLRSALRQARVYGYSRAQLVARHHDNFTSERYADVAGTAVWALLHTVDLLRGRQRRISYLRLISHLIGQFEGSRAFGTRHLALRPPRPLSQPMS